MSQLQLQKSSDFIITYDAGDRKFETQTVPHKLFYADSDFHNFIVVQKCAKCGLETSFEGEQK